METKIDHIIMRVLTGEASYEDVFQLSDWLNQDEKNKIEFSRLKNYWDAEVSFDEMISPTLSFDKTGKKIKEQEKKEKRKQLWRTWGSLAASIVLFICLSIGYMMYDEKADENKEYYTYLTNNNRTFFTLNDGTNITLNKNSKLTYTNTYGANNRYVRLEGEAYFEVISDPENPFEISIEVGAKDASIKVLGTIFSVRIDADEERVIATLVEGTIVFESGDQKIKMRPDQELVYTFATQNINIREVDALDEIAWKDGLIKYKTITFANLMKELEKQYGIEIHIENKKLNNSSVSVSGTFTEKQSLEQILEVISFSLPIKWTKDDNCYYIR